MKIHPIATARLLIALGLLAGLAACQRKPADVAVRPEHEMNPPVATDLSVQRLDAGQVLFTARIPKGELPQNVLAVQLSTDKVVLRDDGREGDEKADDRVFSVVLKQDANIFADEIQKNLGERPQTLVRFVNRSAQPFRSMPFDFAGFRAGKRIPLDLTPIGLAPDPNLRPRSLMITDLGVVQDPTRTFNPCTGAGNPDGAWTFGKLMKGLANTTDNATAVDFIKKWLETWKTTVSVNGESVPARSQIQTILDTWQSLSGPGTLKLERCPFRLLAVVNRLDLRGNSGYGFSNAGEGRFVFCAVGAGCNARQFTVIFEYGIPKRSCPEVVAFAKQWHDLGTQTPGTSTYNTALQAITDQFAVANAAPAKPNGSALNQLRTNELALGLFPWELREFNVDGTSHQLQLTTVKQEPAKKHNRVLNPAPTPADIQRLVNFINTNEANVINNRYEVPPTAPAPDGGAFLGGKSHTENPTSYHWNGNPIAGAGFINNDAARHVFSLNTCSGCHGGEAKTGAFTHVQPRPFGTAAGLSGFLTGLGSDDNAADGPDADPDGLFFVSDPANRPAGTPALRGFNDLKRRADDLEVLVNRVCKSRLGPIDELAHVLRFKPVRMTH